MTINTGLQKDVVCPQCFRQIVGGQIRSKKEDRYGRTIREYNGWCFECDHGFDVYQFAEFKESDGIKHLRWKIHAYQLYRSRSEQIGPLQKVCDLPDGPAVLTGPGGDYDMPWPQQGDTDAELSELAERQQQQISELLQNVATTLGCLKETIECIVRRREDTDDEEAFDN